MLRANENSLFFPAETPKIDLAPLQNLKPFPGEFFAVLDPPRTKTKGGVLLHAHGDGWDNRQVQDLEAAEADWDTKSDEALRRMAEYEKDPWSKKAKTLAFMAAEIAMAAHERMERLQDSESSGAAMEERPDAYTVARVGAGVPLSPGDRVMIAPYAARRLQEYNGVPDVCLIGREDPWGDITILIQSPLTNQWEPLANWIGVKIDRKESTVATVKRTYLNSGVVMLAGPAAESAPGDHVALHRDRTLHRPDDTKWFATHHGPWDGQGILFVREVDSDGRRRVLGTIEMECSLGVL